ncbi:LicD family protein [Leucobacter luti]|uniref:LicD family protein n=1 Tax=Leucobacter luti TaxID=340320 RepID=A0A4R6RQB6_9MICO|nr:LicD family protein [Leucobacter luti]QYM76999.1 LicD family protein [Leucobacter luti]TDP88910.1 LicD family protein [Leucobacter luti]
MGGLASVQDDTTSELSSVRTVELPPVPVTVLSLDFYFDDHRVWSLDVRGRNGNVPSVARIPASLRPYLAGCTKLTVRDSATGEILGARELRFSDSEERVRVVDEQGVLLSVNKWGRLARTLSQFTDSHQLILERSAELTEFLLNQGLRPFIVGGTLLGAVRAGQLLPHDDDADIAYLSAHSHPADVAIEHFRLARALKNAGYQIVQHGGAHMQLHFVSPDKSLQYYIDIFAAFFTDDGCINQPFHVRGPMRRDQLLPFQEVKIGEFAFPAPADSNAWLTVNYDRDWRTPIPGYRLRTKPRTQRRFQNWFGSFNFKRDYWTDFFLNDHELAVESQSTWDSSADWIESVQGQLQSPQLIELGSGRSTLSSRLQNTGKRRVVASDYLPSDVLRPNNNTAEYIHLNLLRLSILQAPRDLGFQGPFDIVANHVLEQTSHFARINALRLIHMSCASGGTALATVFTVPDRGVSFSNPAKWHLELEAIAREAASLGMSAIARPLPVTSEHAALRRPHAIFFELQQGTKERTSSRETARLSKRIQRSAQSWLENRDPFGKLSTQVTALERGLDHRRRDLLRAAEVADMIEHIRAESSLSRNAANTMKDGTTQA